jgi:hypothetical protein
MKVNAMTCETHNPYEESHWVSRLRENFTSGSDGEGLETDRKIPRQSFTRQLMIDEVDTHQRVHSRRPLRSEKPDGVIQEMYGLLLAHYLVRFFMYEASKEKGISPVRLSFINSLRIIRRYVDKFQIVNRNKVEVLYCRMLSEISREYLPVRDHRINPRAVRRKVIKFALKRKRESHASRLCKPFAKSIVMLN